jgi:hypothetical protein
MRLYKDREFKHTPTFDPLLLTKKQVLMLNSILFFAILDGIIIGVFQRMDAKYTLEFLCTLSFTKTYVSFRLFNKQYEFT